MAFRSLALLCVVAAAFLGCEDGGSDDDPTVVPGSGADGETTGGEGSDDGADLPADGTDDPVGGGDDGAGGGEGGGDGGAMAAGGGGVEPEPEPEPMGLPVLGGGLHTTDAVEIQVIADADGDRLNVPRDLAFNPESPDQLWVVNNGDSTMVIIYNINTPEQDSRKRGAIGRLHFLAKPSSLAFGQPGTMATAHDENEITQPSTPADFMGPTLWTTDLNIFDGGHGGHIDMLHNSPSSAGIAWDSENTYWVFDGYHSALTQYAFNEDHGPGGTDHSDGVVRRYVEGEVSYVEGVASHMFVREGKLYVADTGNNRIAALDLFSGTMGGTIAPNYDFFSADQQRRVDGADLSTFLDGAELDGMERPSGLEIAHDLMWVTDNATNRIFAIDFEGNVVDWLDLGSEVEMGGLQGIAVDGDGDLYVVDSVTNRILRISPKAAQ